MNKLITFLLIGMVTTVNANSALTDITFVEFQSRCKDVEVSIQVYEAALNGEVLVQDLKLHRHLQNSLRTAKAKQRSCRLDKQLKEFQDEYFN